MDPHPKWNRDAASTHDSTPRFPSASKRHGRCEQRGSILVSLLFSLCSVAEHRGWLATMIDGFMTRAHCEGTWCAFKEELSHPGWGGNTRVPNNDDYGTFEVYFSLWILVSTSTCLYLFILTYTCSYLFILVHTCSYLFILIHTCSYLFILICTTCFYLHLIILVFYLSLIPLSSFLKAPLNQENTDPVSDFLYTSNFALLGLHEANYFF